MTMEYPTSVPASVRELIERYDSSLAHRRLRMATDTAEPAAATTNASTDLESNLRANVSKLPAFTIRRRVVERLLALPAGDPRRVRGLLIVEGHAAVALNLSDDAEINWTDGAVNGQGTVDWATILKLLMQLLPLILALFGL